VSWHYLPEWAEACSAQHSSDGKQSAELRSTITQLESFCKDKEISAFPCSPSGQTLELLTGDLGKEKWILLLAGFLVSLSQQQSTESTTPMRSLFSGLKCSALYAKWDPSSFSQKMYQKKASETQPRTVPISVISLKSCTFPRQTWAQTINDLGTGLLATPTRAMNFFAPSMYKHAGCRNLIRVFGQRLPRDGQATPLLPIKDRGLKTAKDQKKQDHFAQQWPYQTNQHPRPHPEEMEWLMGWPQGWTDIQLSVKDKFPSYLQQLFPYLSEKSYQEENKIVCDNFGPHEAHEGCEGRERWAKGRAPKSVPKSTAIKPESRFNSVEAIVSELSRQRDKLDAAIAVLKENL
jgi:hypothetical protein